MDNFGKPPQRFGGKLNRLGTGGGGIPSIDDMMFDMGPMRAGAGAARPKGLLVLPGSLIKHKTIRHMGAAI